MGPVEGRKETSRHVRGRARRSMKPTLAEEAVRLVIRVTMACSSAVFAGCAEKSVSTTDLSDGMLQRTHFSLQELGS